MIQLKLILFILSSFFSGTNGNIAAEKTTVIVHPDKQQIEILHQDLLSIIQLEQDSINAIEQWRELYTFEPENQPWIEDLAHFTKKEIAFDLSDERIDAQMSLQYTRLEELEVLGFFYNKENNTLSFSNSAREGLQTKDGELIDSYWVFPLDSSFSFTLAPFENMPERFQQFKRPLHTFINQ